MAGDSFPSSLDVVAAVSRGGRGDARSQQQQAGQDEQDDRPPQRRAVGCGEERRHCSPAHWTRGPSWHLGGRRTCPPQGWRGGGGIPASSKARLDSLEQGPLQLELGARGGLDGQGSSTPSDAADSTPRRTGASSTWPAILLLDDALGRVLEDAARPRRPRSPPRHRSLRRTRAATGCRPARSPRSARARPCRRGCADRRRRETRSTTPAASPTSTTSPIPNWSSISMNSPLRQSLTRLWAPKPRATPAIPAPAISGARSMPSSPRMIEQRHHRDHADGRRHDRRDGPGPGHAARVLDRRPAGCRRD